MAHLNLYLPDEIADALKREASSASIPLSRYVLSLITPRGNGSGWPPEYFDRVCGFLSEEIAEPADALPEPVEDADLGR